MELNGLRLNRSWLNRNSIHLGGWWAKNKSFGSSILALDWLGTKALYNLGVDGLIIKAASLVELNGLRLNRSSIHLGGWWAKNKSFGSSILALDWLGTKALYNLGVDGLIIKAASLVELNGLRLNRSWLNRNSIHLGGWWAKNKSFGSSILALDWLGTEALYNLGVDGLIIKAASLVELNGLRLNRSFNRSSIHLGVDGLIIKAASLVELNGLRLNRSSIHLGGWWAKNKSFGSSILALDWLGTKALYNLGVDGLIIKAASLVELNGLRLNRSWLNRNSIHLGGWWAKNKSFGSSILALDWLGTKALHNLGVDGLIIKAASLVELNGLRLDRNSIHLGGWWAKNKSFGSSILALHCLGTKALYNLGVDGLIIKAASLVELNGLRLNRSWLNRNSIHLGGWWAKNKSFGSSILALDWLGTKALYNLGVDGLIIKAASLVELNGLRLNRNSIHLGVWWAKNKSFGSSILALHWLGTKALYNLGVDGLIIQASSACLG